MNQSSPDIRAVIVDNDETQFEARGNKWKQHKHVASKFYGLTLTDEDIEPHWGKPLEELVCLLYRTSNLKEAMANNRSVRDLFPKKLYPETIPTLVYFLSRNILTGIVTATTRQSLEYDLDTHGVPRDLYDYIQGSDETVVHKPNPGVFKPVITWLERRKISPAQTLYVGDSLHDMESSLGAGLNFLGVETGQVKHAEFQRLGVSSVPNIGYVPSFLTELNFR